VAGGTGARTGRMTRPRSAAPGAARAVAVAPRLTGRRVALRPLVLADAPALFALFSDPDVTRHWSRPPMTRLGQARTLVRDIRAGYRSGELVQWGVTLAEGDEVVGTCTLFHFSRACRRAEVGYALNRRYWGRGLMHDALATLVGYAFGPLDCNRLEADIDPANVRSARILERLGFVREGRLRERWIVAGVKSDSDVYGLLREDWQAP
jgi:[ribosomal protein S5]-alanine N-acetyltransferase